MPIYAYQCTACGKDAEYIQKFSDPPMETCEFCGGPLKRKVTTAAFHLKGGGWYKDLYASSKPDKSGGGGEGGGGSGSASESGSGGAGSSTPSTPSSSTPSGGGESKAAAS
ncbi:MAG: zinc ribbon domain-containing protein [Myxococcales bacterium]|nr:zinc ribbon domain-containing protein [Myxococcales bacterium]